MTNLDEIAKLEDNWNSYDAPAINNKIIEIARILLNLLKVQPKIFPTSNGTLGFEFDINGDYFELEITNECIDYLFMSKDEKIVLERNHE